MAKFIKFNTTDATIPTVLIPTQYIVGVATTIAGAVSTTVITLTTGAWTITSNNALAVSAGGSGTISEAIFAAIAANPGGIVSTVGSPTLLAQAPAAQSGAQGRLVVTQQQTQVLYTGAAYA
ncbi:MAG: hypothetical protein N2B06_18300 [Clostridium sp.]|mgnify:FL=1|jgi:hypothetical protein